jgi:hypothetical protein
MLEKEINFISDFNLNKIKNLGSFFSFDKLRASDIHPSVLQYISAHLDFLIYEDRKRLLRQSAFDYSGAEITRLFNLISDEVKKNKALSFEDVKNLVAQAAAFNANFLMHPKWTLTKLVFENSDSKSIDEVKYALDYVYYFDFIKNIFNAYLKKKQSLTISREEFETVFDKIDKEIYNTQPKQFIDNLLIALTDFFNIGGVSKKKVLLSAVEGFLKEKDLSDYLFRLKRAMPLEPKSSYDVEDIRKILFSTAPLEKQIILEPKKPAVVDEEPKIEQIDLFEEVSDKDDTIKEDNTRPEDAKPEPDILLEPDDSENTLQTAIEDTKPNAEEKTELLEIEVQEGDITNIEKDPGFDDALAEQSESSNDDNGHLLNNEEKIENFIFANNEDAINEYLDYLEEKEEYVSARENKGNDKKEDDKAVEQAVESHEEQAPEEESVEPEKTIEEEIKITEPENTIQDEKREQTGLEIMSLIEEIEETIPETADEEPEVEFVEEEPETVADQESEPETNTPEHETEKLEEADIAAEPDMIGAIEEAEQKQEEMENLVSGITEEDETVIEDTSIEKEEAEEEKTEETPEPAAEFKKDITMLISDKDASKIISGVFKKDNVNFIITLGKISDCKTYNEAADLLKIVFASNDVNPDSRDAAKLTKIVIDFFNT